MDKKHDLESTQGAELVERFQPKTRTSEGLLVCEKGSRKLHPMAQTGSKEAFFQVGKNVYCESNEKPILHFIFWDGI